VSSNDRKGTDNMTDSQQIERTPIVNRQTGEIKGWAVYDPATGKYRTELINK